MPIRLMPCTAPVSRASFSTRRHGFLLWYFLRFACDTTVRGWNGLIRMRFTLPLDPGRGLFERGFGNVIHDGFGWIAIQLNVAGVVDAGDGPVVAVVVSGGGGRFCWVGKRRNVPVSHAVSKIGCLVVVQRPREAGLVGTVRVVVVRFVLICAGPWERQQVGGCRISTS